MILPVIILIIVILRLREWVYERGWPNNLQVRIRFSESAVYEGDISELTEEISNRKRLPIPEMEAGFRFPKGICFLDAENIVISDFVYKRDVFSLRGMEAVTRKYRIGCAARGRYPITQVTARAWSLFHRRKYERTFSEDENESGQEQSGQELLVYAGFTDISGIRAVCNTLLGIQMSRKSIYEDPFSFSSIREYQPDDPMKQINWKASARMDRLMVNTFSSVRSEQYFVFLDISDRRIMKEKELTELGIRIAASLCRDVIRSGQEIGLAVNTDPPAVFYPERGNSQLQKIEWFLTGDFSGDSGKKDKWTSFEKLLSDVMPGLQDRICIVISKENDDALAGILHAHAQEGLPAVKVTPLIQNGEERPDVNMIGTASRI